MAKKSRSSRERITGSGGTRYVRRDEEGQFKEVEDIRCDPTNRL